MANTKKILREGLDRLKKAMEKLVNPKKEKQLPQWALQPVRNKKYLRGPDLH